MRKNTTNSALIDLSVPSGGWPAAPPSSLWPNLELDSRPIADAHRHANKNFINKLFQHNAYKYANGKIVMWWSKNIKYKCQSTKSFHSDLQWRDIKKKNKNIFCFVITFNFMPFQLIDLHAFSINGRQMKWFFNFINICVQK